MDQTKAAVCVFMAVVSRLSTAQFTNSPTSSIGCGEGTFLFNGRCDNCSTNCNRGVCNDTDGRCSDGCVQGFHGQTCQHACPDNCLYDVCDIDTGFCKLGCSHGFYGNMCDLACSVNCNRNRCRRDSGYCSAGCVPGYFGDKCDSVCNSHCMKTCERTSGACNACVDGHYGTNCTDTCSTGCGTLQCRQESGECLDGCRTGWAGPQCAACSDGFYGINCTSRCNKNCLDELQCDAVNGTCLTGCKPGFRGEECSIEVVLTEESRDLPAIVGAVVVSVLFFIILILVLILVLIKRRRRKRNKDFRNREFGNESKSQISRMDAQTDKVLMWNDKADDSGATPAAEADQNYEHTDIQKADPKLEGGSDQDSLSTDEEAPDPAEGDTCNSGRSESSVNNEASIITQVETSAKES